MIQRLLSISLFLAFAASGIAQININVDIKHKLYGEDFSLGKESFTDLGMAFDADRLQYYMSDFSVTHDGGTVTQVSDKWVLVNASTATSFQLDLDSVSSVEAISFYIGVDPDHNHLDPSTFPSSHPLAPKNPSMHWGWTAGYRFVAIEGNCGEDLGEEYQFHALGDGNYFETTVETGGTVVNGALDIEIFANYSEVLRGLAIQNGYILHGEIGECVDVLENFRDYVFTATAPADTVQPEDSTDVTGIAQITDETKLLAYPNPSTNGTVHLKIASTMNAVYSAVLFDVLGNQIEVRNGLKSNNSFTYSDLSSGLYFVRLMAQDGEVMDIARIHVTR
jgi:hypothetical protein